jgi:uncharacterized alpha-E superfamily protein
VLTAAESIITYRRRYRSRAQLDTVLDLLLLDPTNPRGLAYQVEHLHRATTAMPATAGTGVADVATLVGDLLAVVAGVDTTALAALDADGRRRKLRAFLSEVSGRLAAVADAVDDAHFTHQVPQRSVVTPYDPVVG